MPPPPDWLVERLIIDHNEMFAISQITQKII